MAGWTKRHAHSATLCSDVARPGANTTTYTHYVPHSLLLSLSHTHTHTHMMMMIALITFDSSLVPLIEGLCSSNLCVHTHTHTRCFATIPGHIWQCFWTHAHTHTHTHTLFRDNVSGHIQPYACAYISACAHTHTHKHTHIHTYRCPMRKRIPIEQNSFCSKQWASRIFTSHVVRRIWQFPLQNLLPKIFRIYVCA